ncbi:LysR family transcriptional regulator [Pseudochelatococcus sp. B33]
MKRIGRGTQVADPSCCGLEHKGYKNYRQSEQMRSNSKKKPHDAQMLWSEPLSLNFRQVEAFRTVMQAGSMTGAAELLRITQPSVSRLIQDFEAATHLKLFERRGNQIHPTPAAIELMTEVERSFSGLSRIAAHADAISRQSAGRLRIAAMPVLATGVLARFLVRFLDERPGILATLTGMPSHQVVDAVASGHADIGYADGPLERSGFSLEPKVLPAVVALPQHHRLANKLLIEPADLAGERFINLRPGSIFAARVDVALANVPRHVVFETRMSHTACLMVAEGGGVAIVGALVGAEFKDRGVVIKPLSVFIDAGFQAIRSTLRPNAAIVDQFCTEFFKFIE